MLRNPTPNDWNRDVLRILLSLIFILNQLPSFAYAQDWNYQWQLENRPSFRPRLTQQEIYLQPQEQHVDTSVGIPIGTHSAEEFKKSLTEILELKGEDALRNSKIYVLGVHMGQEKKTSKNYKRYIEELGLSYLNLQVEVLSIPKPMLLELSIENAKAVYSNLQYFFPSLKRDYQTPTWGEVASGFNANLLIEIPTVAFLFQNLPTTDATMTAITHATLIGSYIVFQKTLGNWINRAGTSSRAAFLKQASLSLPFILNFNIFGNFSNLVNFVKTNGFEAAAAQFPHEAANFVTTQGFTLFLQTLFYTVVMSRGIRNWVNLQTGAEKVRVARIVSNYNSIPFLALDAVFLAMASTNHSPLMSVGYFDVNMGHLLLAGLTAAGSILALKPSLLDPTIEWYQAYERLKAKYFQTNCSKYFNQKVGRRL